MRIDTKDWIGNSKSTFATLGASNHTLHNRADRDFYATPPEATRKLLDVEKFSPRIWECACGTGHISKVLEEHGYEVLDSDIADRPRYDGEKAHCAERDFLSEARRGEGCCDIITNPPYKYAQEFVEQALRLLREGGKCAFLMRLQFLEGVRRRELFEENPPQAVYVFSRRIRCCMNGDFEKYNGVGSATAFAWFVWKKGFKGDTVVRWI